MRKKNDFLGMTLVLRYNERMEIDAKEYIKSTMQNFIEDEKLKLASALARSNLFKTSESPKLT